MRVIGTAGHVDHGKSTLVMTLTGIDPDRLKEEKAREMTIDLGFAWMTLPAVNGQTDGSTELAEVRVGIVDVPGHIDFIKNMLAGVGGIDAALLVVAADEGVMPQTREHVAILDLLQIPTSVVAVTKIDMIEDPDWLELVQEEIGDLLEPTGLAGAPMVLVSARKRIGLEDLARTLARQLAQAPARPDRGRARLAVDRSFSIAGFGTVVTGTLLDGALRVGDDVEILPAGLTSRVRGLQTHKEKVEIAPPGSRVAVNLIGVRPDEVPRGQVVCLPGTLSSSILLDGRVRLLPGAAPLKHNQLVDVFSGAAEVPAYVRLLDAEILQPGGQGWVQFRLQRPLALARGDHFIIRQPSPSHTLGGGLVVDPRPARRWRRFRPETISRLETLSHGTPAEIWLQALSKDEPALVRTVHERSGLADSLAQAALHEAWRAGDVILLGGATEPALETLVISRSGWSQVRARLAAILDEYHRGYPLRGGMPKGELKSRVDQGRAAPLAPRAFNDLLGYAEGVGLLQVSEAAVRRADHAVTFNASQQALVKRQLAAFRQQPYTPPGLTEVRAALGDELLAALLEQGQLVKLNEDVAFSAATYQELLAAVREIIQQEGSVTVAQVRDRFNTSRKYALALLEYLDSIRVTRRVGDARVLR
ncbi:selenocysteine-specific translation elongation factor [Candidatus Amarolinea aalborgensis]|uniref:selenocysteine-specific translation elongation factor n=1 Tax=Candidatus Amarolinea aalborgensis TaxID=2249329 RepID=UPI003BF9E258